MKKLFIFIVFALCIIINSASASKKIDESKNHCHDNKTKKEYEDLLTKFPADPGIIKLYALRTGICDMIDNNKIDLNTGIDIFELERSKLVIERTKEELDSKNFTI